MVQVRRYERQFVEQSAGVTPMRPAQTAAGGLGEGLGRVGDSLEFWADEVATAEAKQADAQLTEQINGLLYGEGGFMYAEGGNAVAMREGVNQELDKFYKTTMDGLSPIARSKGETALRARLNSFQTRVNERAYSASQDYLNQAGAARITSLTNAAILDPDGAPDLLAQIDQEIADIAARKGSPSEVTELERQGVRDKVYGETTMRLANVDPMAALDYARNNRDKFSGPVLAQIEEKLVPLAKAFEGRQIGAAAAGGSGSMEAAFDVAANMIGMDEDRQRTILAEYMKTGGANMDPAETAWCAAVMNAWLSSAGLPTTGSNMARSFLEWGEAVDEPSRGDIVVLERGAAPFGHVGFFDGYNADGTIRILGGNQGDAINVKGFDPGRVLGFRRAPEGVPAPGMDGLSQILNIEDPVVRDAALAEFELRQKASTVQRNEEQRVAAQSAYETIIGGGSIQDLDVDTRIALGRTEMSGLMALERAWNAGVPPSTSPTAYTELRLMQANEPQQFRQLVATGGLIRDYADKLSQADMQSFIDAGTKPQSDITRAASSTLMTVADRQMEAAGIDTSPKSGSDDAENLAAMQTRLLRWQDAFIEKEGRAPTQTEIDGRVRQELVEVVTGKGWGDGEWKRTMRLYEVDFEGMTTSEDDDLTLADLENNITERAMTIGGTRVEMDAYNRVYADLVRALNGITPEQMATVDLDTLTMPSTRQIVEALAEYYR